MSTTTKGFNDAQVPDILYVQCISIVNIPLSWGQLSMEGPTMTLDGLQGVPKKVSYPDPDQHAGVDERWVNSAGSWEKQHSWGAAVGGAKPQNTSADLETQTW